jgi:hypothetical protein
LNTLSLHDALPIYGRPLAAAREREGEGPIALWSDARLVAVARVEGGLIRPETVLPP